jgi:uncharacterized membrane protein HdeD (DUF308 family)
MDKLEHFLSRHTQIFFSVARIIIGVLFLCHGAQKLFGAFGGHRTYGNTKFLIAGVIEFFGGILFGFAHCQFKTAVKWLSYIFASFYFPLQMEEEIGALMPYSKRRTKALA